MTKPSRQRHWDSYCESEPVSICASAVSVCLYPSSTFPVTRATCSHTHSCLCPPLVLRIFFFFQYFLDCLSLCPFYLFAFPQAPSLSFCWHVQWSVGQAGNAVSSKQHFSGQKNVTSVTKITGKIWLMMPMIKYCLWDHLLSLLLLYYLQHCPSYFVFLLYYPPSEMKF